MSVQAYVSKITREFDSDDRYDALLEAVEDAWRGVITLDELGRIAQELRRPGA